MGSFKDTVRYLRLRAGMSQTDLANNLDIAKSTVSMWENGKREPNFETMEAIADYFNVDMDFLHGREKPATDYDDGLKLLDMELAKLMRDLSPEDAELARAFLTRLKTRKK